MNVDARLNSLEPRFSWFYIRLLLLTGVSWAIQAAELVLLDFSRVLVANDIGMQKFEIEILGASIFLGSMAGGPIFGHLADKFGRRTALLVALVFSLGGLAVSAQAKVMYVLIIGRVITGIGHGGQLLSTVVLVQELAPRPMHGRVVSLLDAFTGIGGLIGLVLAYAVAPWLEWRTTYLLVSGLVLYTVVLRFIVPESPRWLDSVGRTEEASAIVENIEHLHFEKKEVDFTSFLESLSSPSLKTLRSKRQIPTCVLWTLWTVMTLSAYVLGTYIPTLISLSGYNMFANWITIAVLNVAQVVGSFTAAAVLDTYGLHRSFAVFAMLAAAASVVLGHMTWSREVVITFSFLVNALLSACWSCVLTYTPGHFTTACRGRGMGYSVGISRLAAVGGCYLYPHMFNVWILSVPTLCWIFGSVLAVVAAGIVPHFSYQPLKEEDDAIRVHEH
ncbi:hypothetical protein KXD40_004855 [Peronospora effusa]|uniref:Major facilitator superfamily (MFS) profile domain-containing protein n=1 Tax=Peronospora effusa TaxID=542832 RepID=A0A3M6VUV3_9STRA|nr:hypothetical protein DD238_008418 [Peronospora effusa]UIZ22296.1 hypothetical protein KXD40_004855 [Peronospora effusa]